MRFPLFSIHATHKFTIIVFRMTSCTDEEDVLERILHLPVAADHDEQDSGTEEHRSHSSLDPDSAIGKRRKRDAGQSKRKNASRHSQSKADSGSSEFFCVLCILSFLPSCECICLSSFRFSIRFYGS